MATGQDTLSSDIALENPEAEEKPPQKVEGDSGASVELIATPTTTLATRTLATRTLATLTPTFYQITRNRLTRPNPPKPAVDPFKFTGSGTGFDARQEMKAILDKVAKRIVYDPTNAEQVYTLPPKRTGKCPPVVNTIGPKSANGMKQN